MQRNGWGRIINIASVHGLVASANKAAYVSAKHGLVGLTKVVALETAGSGITSNAICPGWTRTELIEPQIIARAETLGVDIEAGGAISWLKNSLRGSLSPSSNWGSWHSFSAPRLPTR